MDHSVNVHDCCCAVDSILDDSYHGDHGDSHFDEVHFDYVHLLLSVAVGLFVIAH